jgi:uncharacterized protein (TIGR03437 family)
MWSPLVAAAAFLSLSGSPWPTFFEPNKGQVAEGCDFLSRRPDGWTCLSYAEISWQGHAMRLIGARRSSAQGLELQSGVVNYHYTNDGREHAGLPTYARVRYANVYPGVDIEYHHTLGELEFDLIVHPGADPRAIAMEFDGPHTPFIAADGQLSVAGLLTLKAPRVFERGGRPVSSSYLVNAEGRVTFQLGDYDRNRELVIDPVVGFVISSSAVSVACVVRDRSGNSYVIGSVQNVSSKDSNSFVMMVRSNNSLGYLTTFGDPEYFDTVSGGAVDLIGNLYVTGWTASPNAPGAPKNFPIRQFASLGLLNNSGRLIFNNVFAFPGYGAAVTLTPTGDAIVVGRMGYGLQLPSDVFQNVFGGGTADAFVARFNVVGAGRWFSFLGGGGDESATDVALDRNGDILVTGAATDSPFPASNPFQIGPGSNQSFLARITEDGKQLRSAIRLPFNQTVKLAVGSTGNLYIGGPVNSASLPPSRSPVAQAKFGGGWDAAVIAINSDATNLLYSTYLGGVHDEGFSGFGLEADGRLVVTGAVYPPRFSDPPGSPALRYDFPSTPGFPQIGAPGAFVVQLDTSGRLIYSTGSAGIPGLNAVYGNPGLDGRGGVYLVGTARRGPLVDGKLAWGYVAGTGDGVTTALVRFEVPTAVRLAKISGDLQSGTVGTLTALPAVVQVTDTSGKGLRGVTVVFKGNRSTSPQVPAVSDGNGMASARLLLDTGPRELDYEAVAEGAIAPVRFSHLATGPIIPQVFSSVTGDWIAPRSYRIETVAGMPGKELEAGQAPGSDVPALEARLNRPEAVLVDRQGNLVIADTGSKSVRQVAADGMIRTLAAMVNPPLSLALTPAGEIVAGDDVNIWRIDSSGATAQLLPARRLSRAVHGVGFDPRGRLTWVHSTDAVYYRAPVATPEILAGDSRWGYAGDGGPGPYAQFAFPRGLVFDRAGNLYLCDASNHRVRKVDLNGSVSTVAGDGTAGFAGDGGLAVLARLNTPLGLAIDADDNLIIADTGNWRVRMVTPDGNIYSIAGSSPGFGGDGGPALAAKVHPYAVYAADSGEIYIADYYSHVIRRLTPSNSSEQTVRALMVNAASFQTGNVAPDELVLLTPAGSTSSSSGPALKLRDSSGAEFEFTAEATQQLDRTWIRIPSDAATGDATLQIGPQRQIRLVVDKVAPGIFTAAGDGTGPPAGSFLLIDEAGNETSYPAFECTAAKVCSAKPISLQDPTVKAYLVLKGTGFRHASEGTIEARVGGEQANVLYLVPEDNGVDELLITIPPQLANAGLLDVQLTVSGVPCNPVWIATATDRPAPPLPPITWEFYRNSEGWQPVNMESQRIENGMWQLNPRGDPYVISPRISAAPDVYKHVQIRMSVACQGPGQVFFTTAADDVYTGSKAVNFDSKACPLCGVQAPFATHTVDMSRHPAWTGVITGIRVDPCGNGIANNDKDMILLDSVRLLALP